MFALYLTADLQGVTNLRPDDTQDNPFWYMFKVQCTSCRETHANHVGVNRFETNEMSGSRGEANFVWKCKNCKRESSASIKAGPFPYEQTEPAKPQKILEFDCRGLEFTEFKAEGEWLAEGVETGTKFTAIDLEEGEWFEYDEKSNEEVVRKGSFKRPEFQSRINFNNQKILKIQLLKMAVSELPGTIDFLTDAAHLLRATAPETSAHLMSQRGHLLQQYGVTVSDVQRQHVCGGCGIIMIPGQEATLKLDARKILHRKAKGKKSSGNSTPKPTGDLQGPCKILHCDNCQRDTKIVLPPPGPAVRRKTAQSKVKKVSTPVEQPKQTSNASSKKRAKSRKAGLQALLSGQKQQTTNPLSLSHFMK
ncbi:hypothetical protein FANTH_1882 [Fusarium anthophilum]|uniref:DUF866-domain-containing protein n=1 Tax=Fusarium anthophilum TaxID=48485 RepID=A0A8H5EAT8_9HYPO|nr:hypothetical protein FANTH_1882 [Fusarium anthophilum]